MDANTIIAAATGLVGIASGFFGGRRTAMGAAIATAVDVVELLQAQVEVLEGKNSEKDSDIANLQERVNVLESLVLQRADVDAVRLEVESVRGVVDRIALKMGA